MKKIVSLILASVAMAFSASAFAQVEICQLQKVKDGPVVASVNRARLAPNETCDSWRKAKAAELGLVAGAQCELLADGKLSFEGFQGVPKRGTSIVKGTPAQGQSCDAWRNEQATKLVTG